MKRREFVKKSSLLLGGLAIARQVGAAPCFPLGLGVQGGTSEQSGSCPQPPEVVPGEAPSWAGSLNLNQWTQLSNVNSFGSVHASDIGQYGNSGPNAVFLSWNSAVLATSLGNSGSMVHWGGGHQDYYGNELYRFNLETLTWSRLNEPSPHSPSMASNSIPNGIFPDGTPGAPHTYNGLVYRSATNEFVTTRRERSNVGGDTTSSVSRFDLDGRSWTNYTGSMSPSSRYTLCVYDPSRDVIWGVATELSFSLSWSRFDFATGNWTNYTQPTGNLNGSAAAYVPTKDCVIFWSNNGSPPYALDPTSPTTDKVELTVTGVSFTASPSSTDAAHWSSVLGKIVYYDHNSDNIYTLTPPSGDWRTGTWVQARVSTSGSSGQHSSNGTYGKFQVAEWGTSAVGILNDYPTKNCYTIKLQ